MLGCECCLVSPPCRITYSYNYKSFLSHVHTHTHTWIHLSMKIAAAADDLHCCKGPVPTSSSQRTGAQFALKKSDFRQDVITSLSASVQSTLSFCFNCLSAQSNSRLQTTACKYSQSYLRIHSASQSKPLRTPSFISSSLTQQLRLLSLLMLFSVSFFQQIDLAVSVPSRHREVDQDYSNLPERCRIPFSYYECGGFQESRYTYHNGSCHSMIEWSGPNCEYDGTENSFATEEECREVCIPVAPTTTGRVCVCVCVCVCCLLYTSDAADE